MTNWKVGDLAIVVDARVRRCECGKTRNLAHHLKRGEIHAIVEVGFDPGPNYHGVDWCGCLLLRTDRGAGLASRFRKIEPLSPEEEREARQDAPVRERERV